MSVLWSDQRSAVFTMSFSCSDSDSKYPGRKAHVLVGARVSAGAEAVNSRPIAKVVFRNPILQQQHAICTALTFNSG